MKILLRIILGIVIVGMTLWGVGLFYLSPLLPEGWRAFGAGGYAVLTMLAFFLLPRRGRTALAATAVFAMLVFLFFRIPASNNRDWQPDVAQTPYATINGDLITIHNVRNFDYRSDADFDPRWENRTYNLSKLDSAEIIAVYWAGKAIAHVMVSFGFEGKDYLTVSIETRKENGESYSTLAGFFRQNLRRIFLDYIKSMNDLRERPSYYNTLTTNCTTTILMHTRMNPESPPMSWKVLLSGYVPDYLYDLGRLDTSRPFAELEKMSRVNDRAHGADKDAAFSQRIREGLPIPAPLAQP
ncbi:MAG: hypothetical protein HW419_3483 [Deltaproteobacteria bacterium]|nr:hypothetical protein [Deltaproteobacteria bacterium]